jgi:predicted nucleotidyltransferase
MEVIAMEMNLTKKIYTIDEIKILLTPIFEERGVLKAILFGSYAKGCATEDSDVDLVVKVEEAVGGLDFYSIGGNVMETLEKNVDFLDLEDVIDGGRSDIEIKKTGVLLYEKV